MRVIKLIPVLCILFASCTKNDTNTATVNFQLKALVSPVQGAGIIWTIGSASVSQIKFEAKKDSSKIELKSETPVKIDLFSAVVIGNINIPLGLYKKVEFKTVLKPTATASSLRLEGNYTAGGITTPIVFETNAELELKGEKDSVLINSSITYTAPTILKLALLTDGITEAELKAATQTGGKIIISPSTNVAIYQKMLANLLKCEDQEFHF